MIINTMIAPTITITRIETPPIVREKKLDGFEFGFNVGIDMDGIIVTFNNKVGYIDGPKVGVVVVFPRISADVGPVVVAGLYVG